jgi:hypothetical protein
MPGAEFCAPQRTCTARRAAGASCSDAATACEQWSTCDATSGTCVPAGKPGTVCVPIAGSGDPPSTYCLIGCVRDGRNVHRHLRPGRPLRSAPVRDGHVLRPADEHLRRLPVSGAWIG